MKDVPAVTDERNKKRPYASPVLSRLGSVSSLTAGGSGSKAENSGADVMLDRHT
jgi:hypothetical protein